MVRSSPNEGTLILGNPHMGFHVSWVRVRIKVREVSGLKGLGCRAHQGTVTPKARVWGLGFRVWGLGFGV